MNDLSRFDCLDSACADHGKRAAGNPTVTGRYASCPESGRRRLPSRRSRPSGVAPGGWLMVRIMTDGYAAYEAAILAVYAEMITPPRIG